MSDTPIDSILAGLAARTVVPYLGPGLVPLCGSPVPAAPETLAEHITSKVSVPHKLRRNLTGAAQFVENFKHRSTVIRHMDEAFRREGSPSELHRLLATARPPLMVHAWYDDLCGRALTDAAAGTWGRVQALSQAEHFGTWTGAFAPDGTAVPEADPSWETLLYEPIGAVAPASNYLVSDSDYVEVLTEIDIQTPIPEAVQRRRAGRSFLFLGCRFSSQLERTFARQVSKRSSDRHWAVLEGDLTRNEERFLAEHGIERIDLALPEFAELLATGTGRAAA